MCDGSRIFLGYRALGYVSNHIPLQTRYMKTRRDNFIITSVGNAFHTYAASTFRLINVSPPLVHEITCMAVDAQHIFTATGNVVYAWRHGHVVAHEYKGHSRTVHLLLPFGLHLVTIDEDSVFNLWDIQSQDVVLELEFNNEHFQITAIAHPSTYINKVLLGSRQGRLQLWNINKGQLIYTFSGWDSPVLVLEQAPAVDVLGIGLESGEIIIHNLKFDATLMKFFQDWGPVTALAFRSDGQPILASASDAGHVAFWNLEEKKLMNETRNAHSKSVAGLKFLPDEPLLVSSSPDNTLKLWTFDTPDGSARQLRVAEGHEAPPTFIRFYDPQGKSILSASQDATLRLFYTWERASGKSLGKASINRKASKRIRNHRHDPNLMPPVVCFAAEVTREKEWDNVVACHNKLIKATTWSTYNYRMGSHKLIHERFKTQPVLKTASALSVALSACGNFAFVGYDTGHVDKFNIQSGLWRGSFGDGEGKRAHDGAIRGLAADAVNTVVLSGGSDAKLRFWDFRACNMKHEILLKAGISTMVLHRESNLLACALDDFSIHIVDVDSRQVARRLLGHTNRITDLTFSPDGRWVVSAAMDTTLRTWDIVSGFGLDCFSVPSACTSVSFSPTGEFLATTHIDYLGVFLWVNRTAYNLMSLPPLPKDFQPKDCPLPGSAPAPQHSIEEEDELPKIEEFQSPEQISEDLVTLSSLPSSRWANLLNLDIIKQRNKPKEPPKVPKLAPFFLPTVVDLNPRFAIPEAPGNIPSSSTVGSRVLTSDDPTSLTEFGKILKDSIHTKDYEVVLARLHDLGPSAVELEMRALGPDGGGSIELVLQMMRALHCGLKSLRDFELCQAYLGLFLKIHRELIAEDEKLAEYLSELGGSQETTWEQVAEKLDSSLCLVSYLQSLLLS